MSDFKIFMIEFLINNKIFFLLILISLILIFTSTINKKVTLKKRKGEMKNSKIFEWLSTYIDKNKFIANQRNKLTINLALITNKSHKNNKIIANNIISAYVSFFIITILISFLFIKNLIFIIIVSLFIIIIPLWYMIIFFKKKRLKARNDFGEVVSIFTTHFAYEKNILNALNSSKGEIPETHKYEFIRLITSMQADTDYINAVNEYENRINYTLCSVFCEILKSSMFNTDGTLEGLIELENLISIEKKSQQIRVNKLDKRKNNIYLWIFLNFVFLAINYALLGSLVIKEFFLHTFAGQLIAFLQMVAIIFALFVIYVVEKI